MTVRLDTLRAGYEIARDDGIENPSQEQIIWYLFLEACDTLKRLPDAERTYHLSSTRSAMPRPITRVRPERLGKGLPPGEAIDRLDEVIRWFDYIPADRIRKRRVLLALGSGLSAGRVARELGVHRDTPLEIKKRALREIAEGLDKSAHAA